MTLIGQTTPLPIDASPPVDAATSGAIESTPGTADAVTETISEKFGEVAGSFEQFADDPSLESAVGIFGPMLLDLGIAILGLVVLVIVVSLVGRWVRRLTGSALTRAKVEPTVAQFIGRLARYAVWIIAIPIAFELFGIKTTSLAAVIGAAGLAIGLGMQGALSNIAAGIILLVLRPIRISDLVEIQDESGDVTDIGIFYTTVNTFSNRVVLIPNSEVIGNKIENLTGNETRRVEVPVGVAYGSDLALAQKTLLAAMQEDVGSRSQKHDPAVWLTEFGDSSINFEVHVWCASREYLTVRHEAIEAIDRALGKADIEIPFPQRTIHMSQLAEAATSSDET